mmetsp:Transcript_5272/g.18986  ORF Transcript_5272/g.18986 Transcript_5272/m.18986 type:complete len:221 (-) Transcript_5272:752-1414(-)
MPTRRRGLDFRLGPPPLGVPASLPREEVLDLGLMPHFHVVELYDLEARVGVAVHEAVRSPQAPALRRAPDGKPQRREGQQPRERELGVESGEVHVDHLRRKAGQVEHGLGDEAPADAEVRAPELGVGLLHQRGPKLGPLGKLGEGRLALLVDGQAVVHDDRAPTPVGEEVDLVESEVGPLGRQRKDPSHQVLPHRDDREAREEPAVPGGPLKNVLSSEPA